MANSAIAFADLTPSGQSQSTCKAIVGQTPVRRCTCPASLNFSSVVAAAAGCKNLPKRVPVLANPQEGISMRNSSSDGKTVPGSRCFMPVQPFAGRLHITKDGGHALSMMKSIFRIAKYIGRRPGQPIGSQTQQTSTCNPSRTQCKAV